MRYAGAVERERKSLDEKSTAVCGRIVNLRRADLASLRDNASLNESTSDFPVGRPPVLRCEVIAVEVCMEE